MDALALSLCFTCLSYKPGLFPTTQNRCKVVFTTRSQDVCARMGVEKPMKVHCLADNEAFDLFKKKVGQVTLGSNPEIPDLARIVARKCRGLPLALNVIGETMSCKRMVEEWHHAIDVLTSYAAQFSGMEDEILPILKYSYDNLKGEQVRSCFLYCTLFPEDDRILKEKLIGYWIGEGIIDGSESVKRAENKGYEIIGSLVRASLLMEEVSPLGSIVCMHDVVREMALWIASDLGKKKEAYVVHAGVGLRKIPKIENWRLVQKMSLMNNEIMNLACGPECLELTTLLLQNTRLANLSSEFFKSMPKLAVLDLSGNPRLSELPDSISELGSLQHLNLSWTDIRELPKGLQKLQKLFHLDLEADKLTSFAGISSLPNLKILNLSCSWDRDIMELRALEHLEILIIGINLPQGLDKFLSSPWLTSCTRSLRISKIHIGSSGISLPVTMENLRDFIVGDCTISEIKMGKICSKSLCFSSLSQVFLEDCKCLKELTFLMFAPNLKELKIVNGLQVEDIINKDKAFGGEESGIVPFAKLNRLVFYDLPELKNIYWSPLPFPCLKVIRVLGCPNLKNLPLNSQSGKHGEDGLIIGYREKEWIESVEWEDEATKT